MPAAAQIILVWSVYYGQDPVSQTMQIGGSACVLSDLLHHSALCRTSTWPMPTVNPCNGLVSGVAPGRGCPSMLRTSGRPTLARSRLT